MELLVKQIMLAKEMFFDAKIIINFFFFESENKDPKNKLLISNEIFVSTK